LIATFYRIQRQRLGFIAAPRDRRVFPQEKTLFAASRARCLSRGRL